MDDQTKNLIENHIESNDVCLFMKGTPDAPQCGFSMAVTNILKILEVNFNGVGSWFLQDDFHVNNQLKITQGSLATGELITLDGFSDSSLVITSTMHLVPSEYSTIQLAVDAATDGDTIYLSNGIYIENINYSGKEFFLLGESRANTIIDRSTGYGMQNGIFNINKLIKIFFSA